MRKIVLPPDDDEELALQQFQHGLSEQRLRSVALLIVTVGAAGLALLAFGPASAIFLGAALASVVIFVAVVAFWRTGGSVSRLLEDRPEDVAHIYLEERLVPTKRLGRYRRCFEVTVEDIDGETQLFSNLSEDDARAMVTRLRAASPNATTSVTRID